MKSFDPKRFKFIKIKDFDIPGNRGGPGVSFYEYKNHAAVNGKRDYLRLNLYLTKSANYVTIWWGLLESIGTEMELREGRLASVHKPDPDEFDYREQYNEELFRGYIDSDTAARYIFKALRVGISKQYALPQVLRAGSDNKLGCYVLEDQ
jgi:hypothetical protein